ncbi:MAG: acyl-CoA thioesterase [Deltaproteobacteria bacterium]|nr:acyl-CoA thioesterase [Deltaproteobacteria bacterium]
MSRTYYFQERVHFPDIDAGGAMYHGRYLDYFDKARQSMLRAHGVDHNDLIKAGYALVVVEAHLRYFKPVRLGDTLHIYSRLVRKSDKVAIVEQLLTTEPVADTELEMPFSDVASRVHTARVHLVGVDLELKKARKFPGELATAFEAMVVDAGIN